MKRFLGACLIAVVCLAPAVASASVASDCTGLAAAEAEAALKKGMAAEAAGQIDRAAGFYGHTLYWCSRDGLGAEAAKRIKPIAKKRGAEEEKRGNLGDGTSAWFGYSPEEGDSSDQRLGAFEWFMAGDFYPDADRVGMKIARVRLEELETVDLAFKVERVDKGAVQEELYRVAPVKGREVLGEEAKVFSVDWRRHLTEDGPIQKSLDLLDRARRWFRLAKDSEQNKLFLLLSQRGESRGDLLREKYNDSPNLLASAIRYYSFCRDDLVKDRIAAVRTKAGERGDEAMKAAKYEEALKYYSIAGDAAKEAEASAIVKKQDEARRNELKEASKNADEEMKRLKAEMKSRAIDPAEREAMRKQARETKAMIMKNQKNQDQRSQFKKEQDDLEKELGM